MSLFHCERCWETPCVCGDAYGYRHLSRNELLTLIDGLNRLVWEKDRLGLDRDKRQHGVVIKTVQDKADG